MQDKTEWGKLSETVRSLIPPKLIAVTSGVSITLLLRGPKKNNREVTLGMFKQKVSKHGVTTFAWQLGRQYDVAATTSGVLASDCHAQANANTPFAFPPLLNLPKGRARHPPADLLLGKRNWPIEMLQL